jgi:hypothetical protein
MKTINLLKYSVIAIIIHCSIPLHCSAAYATAPACCFTVISAPMNKQKLLATFIPVFFIGLLLTMVSCSKEMESPRVATVVKRDIVSARSSIVIRNNSASAVRLTVNDVTMAKFVQAGCTDTLEGNPQSAASIVAETVVTDDAGNPAGQQLVFFYRLKFPANRLLLQQEINIPAGIFFVGIINRSTSIANQLEVSEPGNNNGVITNLDILNNEKVTACGYYPSAGLSTSIKVMSTNGAMQHWEFNNIKLPGTLNQAVILTCN